MADELDVLIDELQRACDMAGERVEVARADLVEVLEQLRAHRDAAELTAGEFVVLRSLGIHG